MMKCQFLWLSVVLMATGAIAQIVVEDIKTDSITFLMPSTDANNHLNQIACALNVILPGAGHLYVGEPRHALGYFTAEIVSLAGLIFCNRTSDNVFFAAQSFAWANANTHAPADMDISYWTALANFDDADGLSPDNPRGYNQAQELNRSADKKYTDKELLWRWNETASRKKYSAMLQTSDRYKVVSNFFIAALVLDRVIAFVDIRVSLKNRGMTQISTNTSLRPYFLSSYSGIEAGIVKKF